MNNFKFAFIICSNNDLLLEEAIHYINHLIIPKGYETELLIINDSPSITKGYNDAMNQTDAKYKIYMHQDVYVLNRNLLSDLLSIFQSDPQIGMIGMVGYETVAPNGIMWNQKRFGNLYRRKPDFSYPPLSDYHYNLSKDRYSYVAEIDGFFMVSAYDLPWDTEILKGWDFYDVFQCIRFLSNGLKIVVPHQKHPWCMHDDNQLLNLQNYNYYRKIFLDMYSDYLGKNCYEILAMTAEKGDEL